MVCCVSQELANFSIGVTTIKPEFLAHFDALTHREATPVAHSGRSEPEFGVDAYVAAFRQIQLAPHQLRMFQVQYHAPERTLTATQMSQALGYPTYAAANLHYGKLGRLVGEQIGWTPLPEQTVFVLVTFEKPGSEWHWIMRPAVARALEQLGWLEAEHIGITEEVEMTASLYEGAVKRISVNAYERNSAARENCIVHYGCRCAACGLSLADKYGEAARGLIHVHHLRQLADVNAEYQVDPVEDLRPVCPTCHAVIHSRTQPFTVQEVTAMIEETKTNANQAVLGTSLRAAPHRRSTRETR